MLRVGFLVLLTASASFGADCELSDALRNEIKSYQSVVDTIIDAAVNGSYSGVVFDDLADFVDDFGNRQQGTERLERAIDNVIERQRNAGLVVSEHKVVISSWTRGEASAEIISPRRHKLSVLSLGTTISTPAEGITAPVIVVDDYDELAQRQDEVPGKIVLINAKYISYSQTATYRNKGPNAASKLKAVAVLVRSITGFSLYTPHTGNTYFDDESLRIPAAAITLEDADMIARLVKKGKEVVVNIKSTAKNNADVQSRNVIGDIVGTTNPDEYVVVSGHIDSWDVGQGAQDDGGGSFVAWHSLALIKALKLKAPRRTIRSILWTAEEAGMLGAYAYRKDREEEVKKWVAAFESDEGVYRALGINFAGNDKASCMISEIMSLFSSINATTVNSQPSGSVGSDISAFEDLVPQGSPFNPPNNYFWYHHSEADYMSALKSEDLDHTLAILSSAIYILADVSERLPKDSNVVTEQLPRNPDVKHSENGANSPMPSSPVISLFILMIFHKIFIARST